MAHGGHVFGGAEIAGGIEVGDGVELAVVGAVITEDAAVGGGGLVEHGVVEDEDGKAGRGDAHGRKGGQHGVLHVGAEPGVLHLAEAAAGGSNGGAAGGGHGDADGGELGGAEEQVIVRADAGGAGVLEEVGALEVVVILGAAEACGAGAEAVVGEEGRGLDEGDGRLGGAGAGGGGVELVAIGEGHDERDEVGGDGGGAGAGDGGVGARHGVAVRAVGAGPGGDGGGDDAGGAGAVEAGVTARGGGGGVGFDGRRDEVANGQIGLRRFLPGQFLLREGGAGDSQKNESGDVADRFHAGYLGNLNFGTDPNVTEGGAGGKLTDGYEVHREKRVPAGILRRSGTERQAWKWEKRSICRGAGVFAGCGAARPRGRAVNLAGWIAGPGRKPAGSGARRKLAEEAERGTLSCRR